MLSVYQVSNNKTDSSRKSLHKFKSLKTLTNVLLQPQNNIFR